MEDRSDDGEDFWFGLPVVQKGDAAAAAAAWIVVQGPGLPDFLVEIRVRKSPDGRLICTGLRAGGLPEVPQEVTARGLRQIPLARILRALALEDVGEEGRRWLAEVQGLELAHTAVPTFERPGTPRGSRLPREHFARVAEVYREGVLLDSRRPDKYVASVFCVSEPTARRYVQKARDLGYLGPTSRGKAGEMMDASQEGQS